MSARVIASCPNCGFTRYVDDRRQRLLQEWQCRPPLCGACKYARAARIHFDAGYRMKAKSRELRERQERTAARRQQRAEKAS